MGRIQCDIISILFFSILFFWISSYTHIHTKRFISARTYPIIMDDGIINIWNWYYANSIERKIAFKRKWIDSRRSYIRENWIKRHPKRQKEREKDRKKETIVCYTRDNKISDKKDMAIKKRIRKRNWRKKFEWNKNWNLGHPQAFRFVCVYIYVYFNHL